MTDFSTRKLLDKDTDSWTSLLKVFERRETPPNDIALALIGSDTVESWGAWVRATMEAREDLFFDVTTIRCFQDWITTAYISTLSGPESWEPRLRQLERDVVREGGLDIARTLFQEMNGHESSVDKHMMAELLVVLMRGAIQEREYETAQHMGELATRLFAGLNDPGKMNFISRRLGMVYAQLGDYDRAFEIFDVALQSRGPFFGGVSLSISMSTDNDLVYAIDELGDIAAWATNSTPEFIRAVGGLAERLGAHDEAEKIWMRFETGLKVLEASDEPEIELEVVVRHAEQRGMTDVMERAIAAVRRTCPDAVWLTRYLNAEN